ncbi:hypothetical protein IFR05_012275 [Cadophora sp. M221]|nr:hypothetical protein IFR05_012275 [Cadophora sp. M221]
MVWLTFATTTFTLWALLLPAVHARVCGNETGTTTGGITVWSQEDADAKLDGCTTLLRVLNIGHNYTGDFVLRGVTNLTRGLRSASGQWWDNPDETEDGVPGLTSISAPDLLETGSFYGVTLRNTTALKSISFEKLRKAHLVELKFGAGDGKMSFPALETITGYLKILGNYSSMDFARLTNVGNTITVLARPDDDSFYFSSDLVLGSNPPLAIDFPSLVNCSNIEIVGNISRMSAPKLATIAEFTGDSLFYNSYYDGLKVYTQGSPLDLKFPSLWNTTSVTLVGTIANLSFSALKHVDTLIIKAELPLSVNIWPLESAETISLSGNLTDYNVTSLQNVTERMIIGSDLSLDCGPGKEIWLRMHPEDATKSYYSSGYYCPKTPKKPFPGKQLGLGLGIGIPVLLLVAAVIWRRRRDSKKETAKKNRLPDYETEMATRRTGAGEVLPEYAPPRDRRSTDRASTVSSLGNMARPTERPPGYEGAHAQEGQQVT